MLKRIEIISGYHNLKEICQGCPPGFSSLSGPQLIYLTIVNYLETENKIVPSFYCAICASNIFKNLGQEAEKVFDPTQGADYSRRNKEWKKLWKEIEFEKKIDSR